MSEEKTINFEDFDLDKIHLLGVEDDKTLESHLELEPPTEIKNPETKLETTEEGEDKFAEAAKTKVDDVKVDEPLKKEDEKVEEELETTTEELLPFYSALNKELGIEEELKAEDLSEGIPGLIGYLKDIVKNTIDGERAEIMEMGNGLLGDLVKFLENGGNPDQFVDTFFKQIDYSKLSVEGDENISNQRQVVEDVLRKQGEDEADIKEKLTDYENAGILEKEAKTAIKKLTKYQNQDKVTLIEQQEKARIQAEENRKLYWDNVVNTIKNSEEIGGLPINKENKDKLAKHLTERGKDGLTNYERNLKTDKDRALKFAYVDMLNFDFSTLETKAKTKATQDIKKAITRFTDTGSKIASKSKNNEEETTKNNVVDFTKFKLPHLA